MAFFSSLAQESSQTSCAVLPCGYIEQQKRFVIQAKLLGQILHRGRYLDKLDEAMKIDIK